MSRTSRAASGGVAMSGLSTRGSFLSFDENPIKRRSVLDLGIDEETIEGLLLQIEEGIFALEHTQGTVKKQTLVRELAPRMDDARDLIEYAVRKNDDRALLIAIFGGDCLRIVRLEEVCQSTSFTLEEDERRQGCLRQCKVVCEVLTEKGYGQALRRARRLLREVRDNGSVTGKSGSLTRIFRDALRRELEADGSESPRKPQDFAVASIRSLQSEHINEVPDALPVERLDDELSQAMLAGQEARGLDEDGDVVAARDKYLEASGAVEAAIEVAKQASLTEGLAADDMGQLKEHIIKLVSHRSEIEQRVTYLNSVERRRNSVPLAASAPAARTFPAPNAKPRASCNVSIDPWSVARTASWTGAVTVSLVGTLLLGPVGLVMGGVAVAGASSMHVLSQDD